MAERGKIHLEFARAASARREFFAVLERDFSRRADSARPAHGRRSLRAWRAPSCGSECAIAARFVCALIRFEAGDVLQMLWQPVDPLTGRKRNARAADCERLGSQPDAITF